MFWKLFLYLCSSSSLLFTVSFIWKADQGHGNPVIGALRNRTAVRLRTAEWWKKCRARPGMHSLAPHFFVILPSWVLQPSCCVSSLIGTLRKTRRQRQRELHQTIRLKSKKIAVHVRFNSLHISLPSSAKQELEMTKFCVVWRTWTTTANFVYFYLEMNAFVSYSAEASFNTGKHTE